MARKYDLRKTFCVRIRDSRATDNTLAMNANGYSKKFQL